MPMKPSFEILPSKAGAGKHNVWAKWPDGDEQLVGDPFDSEAEARHWVENDSEQWVKIHPKNKS